MLKISDLEPETLVRVHTQDSMYQVAVVDSTRSEVSIKGSKFFENYPKLVTLKIIEINQPMSIVDYDGNKLDTIPVESFEVKKNSSVAVGMIKDCQKS